MTGTTRTVFVSGQVPWADADGTVPATFAEQCRLTWPALTIITDIYAPEWLLEIEAIAMA